jgi:hypothetical protein
VTEVPQRISGIVRPVAISLTTSNSRALADPRALLGVFVHRMNCLISHVGPTNVLAHMRHSSHALSRFTGLMLATNLDVVDLMMRLGAARVVRGGGATVEVEAELPAAAAGSGHNAALGREVRRSLKSDVPPM